MLDKIVTISYLEDPVFDDDNNAIDQKEFVFSKKLTHEHVVEIMNLIDSYEKIS